MNAYIICIICTRGRTIKRIVQSGGETPYGNIPLPLMTRGERFIRCRRQRHSFRGRDLSDAEDRGMVPGGA